MKKNNRQFLLNELTETLLSVSYNDLPISDYNKEYIGRIYPALSHYMQIFSDCLYDGIQNTGLSPQEITLIDYGGGSGFLSILAKKIGIKKVIYIDLNPDSVHTAGILKKHLGIGPDIILEGDSGFLRQWCEENRVQPDLLIATDLIEHIYDLKGFFSDLFSLGGKIQMIFTTASTPYNPYIKRRLRKMMQGCESGNLENPNYLQLRKEFIRNECPEIPEKELEKWGNQTRGLKYDDIRKALQKNEMPTPDDPYNTCDPATGNWTERILPMATYRNLLLPYGYQLEIKKGFYNTGRKKYTNELICKWINFLIHHSGKCGYYAAPFLYLIVKPE